jgi:dolichol-phosphate mannosyltransferase
MDADLSHDPAGLPRLLTAVHAGAGLALGSRYADGGGIADWGAARRAVSRGGSWYARRVLGVDVRDLTGGFKCFRADVLRAIDLPTVRSHGYAFQVELTYRTLCAGYEVVEVPIVFRDRRRGESKMSWRIAVEAAWLVPSIRRSARGAVRHAAGRAQAPGPPRRSDV